MYVFKIFYLLIFSLFIYKYIFKYIYLRKNRWKIFSAFPLHGHWFMLLFCAFCLGLGGFFGHETNMFYRKITLQVLLVILKDLLGW